MRVTDTTFIEYDGPAGTIVVEPTGGTSTQLVSFVPIPVVNTAGTYSVTVLATDIGQNTRAIGPATFTVVAEQVQQPPLLSLPESVNVEATSPSGAIVTFSVSAVSFVDASATVMCDHVSGALYPLGDTTVTCSATDSFATTFGTFEVIVSDTTAPVLTLPGNILSGSPVVSFSVSATDNIDGPVTVICSPASGSTFPLGTTTVRCSAEDTHANVATGFFNVTYATGAPPSLTLPGNLTVEATLPFAAVVTFSATSDVGVPVVCSPPSGSTFFYGTTTVQCSSTNGNGATTSGSFTVSVVDTTPPVLFLPADITVMTNDHNGAVVTFTASSTDVNDIFDAVVCTPASGSLFPVGTTTVSCSAMDQTGNTSTGTFHVTVNLPLPPPTLTLPNDFTVEATGPSGALVTYVATANQGATVVCTPPSGSTFPIGTTTVSCTATNNLNESTTGSFHVTVADTTPPTLALPADITAEATSAAGAPVTYTATATDIVDGTDAVQCAPVSGSEFPFGTTTVNCSSTDAHGNSATGSFHVLVQDTTPPQILSVTANPDIIWPPDQKMIPVTITVATSDISTVTSHIVSVTSNQNITNAFQITGPLTVNLKADRDGSTDRVYTIHFVSVDAYGNTATGSVDVFVLQRSRAVAH